MPRFHWLVVYRASWRQLRLVYGRPERTVEHWGDAGTIRRGIAYRGLRGQAGDAVERQGTL